MIMDGKRSSIPEDFTPSTVAPSPQRSARSERSGPNSHGDGIDTPGHETYFHRNPGRWRAPAVRRQSGSGANRGESQGRTVHRGLERCPHGIEFNPRSCLRWGLSGDPFY